MSFKILSTGMYVPPRIVTNDELSGMVETNDEWIKQRVGISERRVSIDETAADMGSKAAEEAIERSGISASDIDLIIGASVSSEEIAPSLACTVQSRLGIGCMAFDINAACSAFLFLLETAAAYFSRGYKCILVVGAERMSRVIDWTDRSTCVIFGDGAGAAILVPGENYIASEFNVHGGDSVIKIPTPRGNSPFYEREEEKTFVRMNGQETFKYAVNAICADIRRLLSDTGSSMDDMKYIVPHQANARIIDFAAQRLKIDSSRFYQNIAHYGNTSSASIPIALTEMDKKGLLQRGDKIILCAFGGGLADAACLIEW